MNKILILFSVLAFGFSQQRQPVPTFNPSSSKNASTLRDLDYEVVKLSYIQTDRALAILKTMGYTVVEYRAGKGEIAGENNFTPIFSRTSSISDFV